MGGRKLKTQLSSRSIYAFNLDQRLLQIMDADMLIPSEDILCEEDFIVKTIRPGVTVERAYIQMMDYSCNSITEALEVKTAPVPEEIAYVTVKGKKVVLNINKPLEIKAGNTVLFRLDYKIPLKGTDPELFFCGAIQPSDYLNLRDILNIGEISKEIILQPHSKRQFRAWVFDASEPIAFPTPEISESDRVQRISKDFKLNVKLTDWERAKYFGIFVQ